MSAPQTAASTRPYHHGDLRQALLSEAERILETDGIQALTLRGVARAVGVTHAAPKNHFGDLTGLLSDLAADGFQRFSAALTVALGSADKDVRLRIIAMGRAYVAFARAHPGMFTLMFRSERLDAQRPALHDAMAAARQVLRTTLMERRAAQAPSAVALAAQSVAMWSLVHGLSTLLLEGRLQGALAAVQDEATTETFIDAVLGAVMLK